MAHQWTVVFNDHGDDVANVFGHLSLYEVLAFKAEIIPMDRTPAVSGE